MAEKKPKLAGPRPVRDLKDCTGPEVSETEDGTAVFDYDAVTYVDMETGAQYDANGVPYDDEDAVEATLRPKKGKLAGPRPAHQRYRREQAERRAELEAMTFAALRKFAREEHCYDRYELADASKTKDMLIGSLMHGEFGQEIEPDYVHPDDAPKGAVYHSDDGQVRITTFANGRTARYIDAEGRGGGAHGLRTYYAEEDLKALRVSDLRELAEDWNITVPSRATKSALIALLLADG